MGGIADELVSRDRSMREEGGGVRKEEKSIIGLLCEFLLLSVSLKWRADRGVIVKAEDKSSSLAMTQEEILAQVSICGFFVFMNLPDELFTRWYLGFFSRVFEPDI